MAKIALVSSPQHLFKREPYECQHEWPEDCFCQGGGSGVVINRKDGTTRRTAFFEAFPKDEKSSGFIRGEGTTILEAETKCWEQYQRELACPDHEFEPRTYKNGCGFCKHCNCFKSGLFTWACAHCGEQTSHHYDHKGEYHLCQSCYEKTPEGLAHLEKMRQLNEEIAKSEARAQAQSQKQWTKAPLE